MRLHVRGRRGADQRGSALLAVLAAVGVFSIILAALFGMLFTDMSVRSGASRTAASTRSVDGALDAAVNQIKLSNDGSLGRPNRPCHPVGTATTPIPYSVEVDGTTVEVDCVGLPAQTTELPIPATQGPALTLLGGYTGPLDDLAASNLVTNVGGSIANAAGSLNAQLASYAPGLVGLGPQPLRVMGDVTVKQWGIGQRSGGPSPWLQVEGAYRQGQYGPLGGLGIWILGTYYPLSPPCGLLDPNFPLLPDVGARVAATRGMSCGTVTPDPTAPPPPKTWDVAAMAAAAQTVPTTCAPVNGVVTIPPGFYDWPQTAKLNTWFGIGQCDDVTFYFPPGDYFFDVAGGDPNARSALKFADHTANWVFGAPQGWNPATGRAPNSAFPAACDPTGGGVTITLSGRTTIRHELGLVAMCGQRDATTGAQKALIYQTPLPSTIRWAGVPTPGTGATSAAAGGEPAFSDPSAATRSTTLPLEGGYVFPPYGGSYDTSEGATPQSATVICAADATACNPSLRLTGFSAPNSPAYKGDLGQVRLMIRGAPNSYVASPSEWWLCPQVGGLPDCPSTGVRIDYAGGGSCLIYQSDVPRGLYALDLGSCRSQGLVDATQLEGATVTIYPLLRKRNEACGWIWWPFWYVPCNPMAFSVEYAWLDVTTNNPTSPSSMSTWVDPAGARTAGLLRGINFFGPVYVPRTQVEVNWWGSVSDQPIFAGSLVAKSLASWPETGAVQVGMLAAPSVQPVERRVLIRAKVGDRLRGTAIVTVTDKSTASPPTLDPGRLLSVDDWRLCNEAWVPEARVPCQAR